MAVVFTEKDFRRAMRRAKIREGINNVCKFIGDNIVVLSFAVPIVAGVTSVVVKGTTGMITNAIKAHAETVNKDQRCYDPSLGHYWELKRKLSNSEWTRIDNRRKNGERLSEILKAMNVLK